MLEQFPREKKVYLLIIAVILITMIFFWPVYFFVFSGTNKINLDLLELFDFIFVEFVLIIILFLYWKIYEKRDLPKKSKK